MCGTECHAEKTTTSASRKNINIYFNRIIWHETEKSDLIKTRDSNQIITRKQTHNLCLGRFIIKTRGYEKKEEKEKKEIILQKVLRIDSLNSYSSWN